MTKAQLTKIMKRNKILKWEIDDAIAFVTELLEHQAKEIEEKEPYATCTIHDIENAASIVWNLQDYVGDVTEE